MKKKSSFLAFAVTAALMVLLYPQAGKFGYEYQKGSPWIYETLISPIDFPILKTESELLREKEEKASQVMEYYNYDEKVAFSAIDRLIRKSAEVSLDSKLTKVVVNSLGECYDTGIITKHSDDDLSRKTIFLKKGKSIEETPAQNIYDRSECYTKLISDIVYNFSDAMDIDSIVRSIDLESYIAPNIFFDQETSQQMHRDAVNYISPTKGMVYAGQLIVSKGELVTSDIAQLLDSYKIEYKTSFGYSGSHFSLILSHVLLVLAVLALLWFAILFVDRKMFENFRQILLILLIVFISFASIVIMWRVDQRLMMLLPFAVLALYLGSFFKDSMSLTIYVIALFPLLIIPENGVMLFLINAVTGGIALVAFGRFNRGLSQFANALFVFAGAFVVYIGYKLLSGEFEGMWRRMDLLYLGINSLLVVVCYPFVFILEKVSGFVSYTRLWDLTDTNTKILKELSVKAPGTFQHSLQVANLAEAATREIGGDTMLARVGALYHDIGKIDNPSCFIENLGPNAINEYHRDKSPKESAREILQHVPNGVQRALKAHLPDIVTDFIRTHHGRTMAMFFYDKYCKEGGDPLDKDSFTYDGMLPQTKEQAIVMIADSVEAASRTLGDYSPESISALVDKITFSKIEGGQLKESDISLRQIRTVRMSLKEQLQRIYHGRIAYPERK